MAFLQWWKHLLEDTVKMILFTCARNVNKMLKCRHKQPANHRVAPVLCL